jgi:hypothetical protein
MLTALPLTASRSVSHPTKGSERMGLPMPAVIVEQEISGSGWIGTFGRRGSAVVGNQP